MTQEEKLKLQKIQKAKIEEQKDKTWMNDFDVAFLSCLLGIKMCIIAPCDGGHYARFPGEWHECDAGCPVICDKFSTLYY